MAWITPRAGDLRDRVQFQREVDGANVGGVVQTGWQDIPDASRACKLEPTRGGEAIVADRVEGSAAYDIWVRFDSVTSTITAVDRAVNTRTGAIYGVKWIEDPTRKRQWLLMQTVQEGR